MGTNDASFNDGTGVAALSYAVTTLTNPYKFRASRNAAANTGNNAFAKITFDTEQYDSNSNFATGTYTAPVNGFYHFDANFAAVITSDAQEIIISLYKNSAEAARGSNSRASGASQTNAAHASADLQLTAADTMETFAYGSAAFALSVAAITITYFNGHLFSKL